MHPGHERMSSTCTSYCSVRKAVLDVLEHGCHRENPRGSSLKIAYCSCVSVLMQHSHWTSHNSNFVQHLCNEGLGVSHIETVPLWLMPKEAEFDAL